MSIVASLRLQHVRSHQDYAVTFHDGVTVITGPNGSGKTTILEAIYIALQGTSFKSADAEVLRATGPWWRIDLVTVDGDKRAITYDPERVTKKKQFQIDQRTLARLVPKYKHPVVLFEPEDLRLLNGSPARRRQFIDRFISQLNPLYATALRKYERALKQRNTLLKRPYIANDELFAWNIALAEHGAYIIEQRIAFVEKINSQLTDAYNDIAQSSDVVSMHYSHTFVGDIKQKLLDELHARAERDRLLGNTSVGPHRHDVIFHLNEAPVLSTASRGETRTIVLALKFLEVAIIEQLTGLKPLILLDDVFSELDEARQQALSRRTREHQIIMTSTHIVGSQRDFTHITLGD
tara:strand:- start:14924 stop:15973 length:1050 start_codon:yes stop_codon:yes gene_type:complete